MSTGLKWGRTSLARHKGVDVRLIEVATFALTEKTRVDFGVAWMGGTRTGKQQLAMYESGASQLDGHTKLSQHQIGNALDLIPYVKGLGYRQEWALVIQVADAMRLAALKLDIPLRWGGSWRTMNKRTTCQRALDDYLARKAAANQRAFPDGFHFELA
jgi:peptidoglycan L-alanyl-D-glutamate endopeptidase CwlK